MPCLAAITPRGSFCFVYDLDTWSISDKRKVEDSGYLENIEFDVDSLTEMAFSLEMS